MKNNRIIIKFFNNDGMVVMRKDNEPFSINLMYNPNFDMKTNVEMHLHTMVSEILGLSGRRGINFKAVRGVRTEDGIQIVYVILPTLSKRRITTTRFAHTYKIIPLSDSDMILMSDKMNALHRPKSHVQLFTTKNPLDIIYMIREIFDSKTMDFKCHTLSVLSIEAPSIREVNVKITRLGANIGLCIYNDHDSDMVIYEGGNLSMGRYYSYEELHGILHKAVVKYLESL